MVHLRSHRRRAALICLLASTSTHAATVPQTSQPTKSGKPGTFEVVGNSLVSAQQLFLGTENTVYIIDKTENNPVTINNHPAWASEYSLDSNEARPMDVISNTFCAGGSVLGDGRWMNVGGNQAVTWGGATADSQFGGQPYENFDGGKAVRFLTPCNDKTCNWDDNPQNYLSTRRWYPTLETLEEGNIIIIGGNQWGGFVNDAANSNPTYEFYPSQGAPIGLPLLETTLPANLFPLTWQLPSGNLLLQINWKTSVFDYKKSTEYPLPDIPDAVRTYPASAATVMLPMTPANGWTATVLFCGGTDLEPDQWTVDWNLAMYPGSDSCVSISPDVSAQWAQDDRLPEGRVMGSFILLPNGKVFLTNGCNTGVAGYGNNSWAIGHSYGDNPILTPLIYDPAAPLGSRFSRDGLSPSTVPRMYHSAATLLPDGSVFVSGSNPNPDYIVGPGVLYPSEYRVERFYPEYYDKPRPQPTGLQNQLGYGGDYFNVSLSLTDLAEDPDNLARTTAVLIRTGFSTHAMNMGQRMVQLDTSYTGNDDGSGVLHVSGVPSAAIFPPGPALFFIVVNGVPSVGVQVMVGSGQIGPQQVLAAAQMPPPSVKQTSPGGGNGGGNGNQGGDNSASVTARSSSGWLFSFVAAALVAIYFSR